MVLKFLSPSVKYALRLRLVQPSLSSSLLFNYRLSSSSSLQHWSPSSRWSSSAPPSKYDLFFPSFYREYVSNIVDWYTSQHEFDENELPDSYHIDFLDLPDNFPDFYKKPHYMHSLNGKFQPIPIEVHQHFDLISLLSAHGDDLVRVDSDNNKFDFVKVNNLRGKYVLLCCTFIPSLWIDSESFIWRLLSSQLSQMRLGSNFEIVFVPKMRRKWDNDEGVFNHFLSAFSGCLVVPFTHKYRRDYICKSLDFDGETKAFLLDPSHNVLEHHICSIVHYEHSGYHPLMSLGYQHSFTPSASNKSLAGILSCESNPSSFLLHKLGSDETISIEQLNNHYVGLYLFRQGCCFKILRNIYQQCRNQGLNFEVVLVCVPFNTPIHPEMFQDIVHCVMKKHQVSDWWVFPYNHSVCLRLEDLDFWDSDSGDHMIVVGPQNKFVEMEAHKVLRHFGLHFGTEAYPFTTEALLQAFLRRLDTITLDSFLTYDYVYRDYKCDDGERMPVPELKGKNVLVYVDRATCFETPSDYRCGKVSQWYNVIKEKDPDFEVVFVPKHDSEYLHLSSNVKECIFKSKTKWLVCPFDDPMQSQIFMNNHDAFLLRSRIRMELFGLPIPSVLAFSEDGHLYSLDALHLLHSDGLDAYPFLSESRNLNLCDEITQVLRHDFDLDFYV